MGTYASYVAVLAEPAGTDLWEDALLDEAARCLWRFVATDWQRLRTDVARQPASWRARCAQTAGDGDPAHAVPLLLALLQDADRDVVEAAADSLHSLVQDGADVPLDDAARGVLTRLATGSGLVATVASRLLDRASGRAAP